MFTGRLRPTTKRELFYAIEQVIENERTTGRIVFRVISNSSTDAMNRVPWVKNPRANFIDRDKLCFLVPRNKHIAPQVDGSFVRGEQCTSGGCL